MPQIRRNSNPPPLVIDLISSSSSSPSASEHFVEIQPAEEVEEDLQEMRETLSQPTSAPLRRTSRKTVGNKTSKASKTTPAFDVDADEEYVSCSSDSDSDDKHAAPLDLAADADEEDDVPPPRPPGPRKCFRKKKNHSDVLLVKTSNGREGSRPVYDISGNKIRANANGDGPSESAILLHKDVNGNDGQHCHDMQGHDGVSDKGVEPRQKEVQSVQNVHVDAGRDGEHVGEGKSVSGGASGSVNQEMDFEFSKAVSVHRRSVEKDVGVDVDHVLPKMRDVDGKLEGPEHRGDGDAMQDIVPDLVDVASVEYTQHSTDADGGGLNVVRKKRFAVAIDVASDERHRASKRVKNEHARITRVHGAKPVSADVGASRLSRSINYTSSESDSSGETGKLQEIVPKASGLSANPDHENVEGVVSAPISKDTPKHSKIVEDGQSSDVVDHEQKRRMDAVAQMEAEAHAETNVWRDAIIWEGLLAYRYFSLRLDNDASHLCAPMEYPYLRKMMVLIGEKLGADSHTERYRCGSCVQYFRSRNSRIFPNSEKSFRDACSVIVDDIVFAHHREEFAKQEAEAISKRKAEAAAKREAESAAKREVEAALKREAEATAKREAEAAAKREMEAAAKREMEAAAKREIEAAAAKREIEAAAKLETEAAAKREAQAKAAAAVGASKENGNVLGNEVKEKISIAFSTGEEPAAAGILATRTFSGRTSTVELSEDTSARESDDFKTLVRTASEVEDDGDQAPVPSRGTPVLPWQEVTEGPQSHEEGVMIGDAEPQSIRARNRRGRVGDSSAQKSAEKNSGRDRKSKPQKAKRSSQNSPSDNLRDNPKPTTPVRKDLGLSQEEHGMAMAAEESLLYTPVEANGQVNRRNKGPSSSKVEAPEADREDSGVGDLEMKQIEEEKVGLRAKLRSAKKSRPKGSPSRVVVGRVCKTRQGNGKGSGHKGPRTREQLDVVSARKNVGRPRHSRNSNAKREAVQRLQREVGHRGPRTREQSDLASASRNEGSPRHSRNSNAQREAIQRLQREARERKSPSKSTGKSTGNSAGKSTGNRRPFQRTADVAPDKDTVQSGEGQSRNGVRRSPRGKRNNSRS